MRRPARLLDRRTILARPDARLGDALLGDQQLSLGHEQVLQFLVEAPLDEGTLECFDIRLREQRWIDLLDASAGRCLEAFDAR